jgi:preprotein translocase subunit Sec61beta
VQIRPRLGLFVAIFVALLLLLFIRLWWGV